MRTLNKEQINASRPDKGINLVLAGAGTGKTTTMIAKIKNVITHNIARPEEILILTFSIKAAGEIKERLSHELCPEIKPGFTGTFHSFALKLLHECDITYLRFRGISSFPEIIDNEKKKQIMHELIMKNPAGFLGLPAGTVMKLAENFYNLDRRITDKLKSGNLYDIIFNIRKLYDHYKTENSLIEFEDMIDHAVELLTELPELKKSVSEKFSYIFVDEFQDTSENNFNLLKLVLNINSSLFMVGDDYQSIYKFRRSRVEYIINAEKFFPDLSIHKLTVNYRSHKEIVSVSNRFIRLNRFRTSKKIRSYRGKGGRVVFHEADDMHHESELLSSIIVNQPAQCSIAVLFRNNYQGDFLRNRIKITNSSYNIEFLTMHGSKGLEFDTVIIAGICDRIIPDSSTDLEEERRLFYVALTRAKNNLHLIWYREHPDKLPRFIKETGLSEKSIN